MAEERSNGAGESPVPPVSWRLRVIRWVFVAGPLVLAVILWRKDPLTLAVFVGLFLLYYWTMITRCRRCGHLMMKGLWRGSEGFRGKCIRCRRPLA